MIKPLLALVNMAFTPLAIGQETDITHQVRSRARKHDDFLLSALKTIDRTYFNGGFRIRRCWRVKSCSLPRIGLQKFFDSSHLCCVRLNRCQYRTLKLRVQPSISLPALQLFALQSCSFARHRLNVLPLPRNQQTPTVPQVLANRNLAAPISVKEAFGK